MQPVLGEDFEGAKASGMADEGRGQGLKWREDETFQKQNKRENRRESDQSGRMIGRRRKVNSKGESGEAGGTQPTVCQTLNNRREANSTQRVGLISS